MANLNNNAPERDKDRKERINDKKEQDKKIDEQLEQTFPASDPPSYSQPGNDLEDED